MRNLLLCFVAVWLTSCTSQSQEPFPEPEGVDLFYILSTEVIKATDAEGQEIYNSTLCPADTLNMFREKEYVRSHYAGDLRFVAPYYEQFTMNATEVSPEVFSQAYQHALADMKTRFEDYMAHENQGRPFFLMGFSQGAMIALDLLKSMPEELYVRCAGVYMLGYRLAQEDVDHPHVSPATSATSGNVISFNSLSRPEASLPLVAKDAVTCINPLNWRTDSEPATLIYKGDTATVAVDTTLWQLMVTGLDEDKYVFLNFPKGNLHHWDLLFYSEAIRENMAERIE